jgi:hydrogenase nickel incorporation protein HypA/HybF
MHEMAIVRSIMDIIEDQAKQHNAQKVIGVNLEFGFLTAVQPQAVRFAFDILSEGTCAQGATLNVKIIPLKVKCVQCGAEKTMDRYDPFCSVCQEGAVEILEGKDEMRIASLEVED